MLTIKHLVKRYPHSDRKAVDDINIELRPGEIFGFLGQNGAGKSTTIKCLTGILPFDEGSIEVCGYDLAKDPINAKYNIGYVPDNHSVYEKLTGVEYVNYVADLYRVPTDIRQERLEKYLKIFKLEAAANRQIKSYSHGMKQKICIIAALIHEPKLWVLDEPMMGLDPQSTAEIIAHMREHCAKGNTVFFSSHNLDLVKKLCHRVAIINQGKLIDTFDLKDNPENQENLEVRFFKITGTYEKRLFDDYCAQEMSDVRPDEKTQEIDYASKVGESVDVTENKDAKNENIEAPCAEPEKKKESKLKNLFRKKDKAAKAETVENAEKDAEITKEPNED
ncbi:MAG: ABC transporter ATP-binding protein [Acidaminococcus sp.]|nr:ABC transporter ATP-binding protein [Acidaminococcus sp.]MDY4559137.1 ABC transporter ATP-binding protein [Eubacteriales bacterium]